MGEEEEPKKESDLKWVRDIEEIDKISELPFDIEGFIRDKALRLIDLVVEHRKESQVSHPWERAFNLYIEYSIDNYCIGQVAVDAFRAGIIWGKYINELEEIPEKEV